MSMQLPLALSWRAERELDRFAFVDPVQRDILEAALTDQCGHILIVGPTGSGKSYLLQALAQAFPGTSDLIDMQASALERTDASARLLLADNLNASFGNARSELWLFNDFNRAVDRRALWIGASSLAPDVTATALPDLRSRLQSCVLIRVPLLLAQADQARALNLHAARMGLSIDTAVISYLQTHVSRDITQLMDWVMRLNQLSLSRKRKPSIAMVRELLALAAS